MNSSLGFEVTLHTSYDNALELVAAALKAEGFGVLTRIDVRATLQEKLGVNFRPYTILGACNPPLAHRALSANPEVGLLLPCNLTVEEMGDQLIRVRIANPQTMMQVGDLENDETIHAVAQEAQARLERVASSLSAG